MNNIFSQIILFLFTTICIAQTDNSITVTGKSSKLRKGESIRMSLYITGIEKDEYRNISELTIEDILIELEKSLKVIGYSNLDLKYIFPPKPQGRGPNTKSYYLELRNEEEAKKVYDFSIKGLRVGEIEYYYPDESKIDQDELYEEAVKDAREKAVFLAESVDKKIGEVISIIDKTHISISITSYSNFREITLKYSLIIEYELLDL